MPDNILFPELQENLSQNYTPEYNPSFDYFKNLTNDTYRRAALEYNKGNKSFQNDSPFAGLEKIRNNEQSTYSFPEYFSPKNEDYDAIKNSKYFPEFGFVKGSENNSTYRNLQTFGDRFENAIIGGGKIAAFQFVDQLKGWGRIVDAAASWDWSKLYDQNDMEEVNKNLERIMAENRIFTDKRDDDSIFTWANTFNIVQQSGFTIGAIAEIAAEELLTAGFASGLQGTKVANLLRTLGSWGKAAEKLQDATTSVNGLRKIYETGKFLPMGETISGIAAGLAKEGKSFKSVFSSGFGGFYRDIREMNAAFTEARAEASGTYAELKDTLLNDGASAQDADRIAREAAGTNFAINSAVIGLSNKIQFDNIFRGIKGAKSIIEEGSPLGMWKGQFFKRGFNLNTLKEGLRNRPIQYFKNNLTEALQENVQESSNIAVQKYYETRYKNPGKESISESLSEGIESQYSKQGMKTFLGGFLTGAITSPLTSGIGKLYRRVGTTSEQRQRQKADTNEKVASLNGLFSSQHAPNSGLQLSIGDAMADSIKMGDTKGFQDLKDQSVREFVRTSIETGQFDAVFARLDNYIGKLSKTEFEKAFGIPFSDKGSAVDYVNSLREKANAIKETNENFEFRFGANPFSPVNSKVQHDAYNNAKWQYLFMKDAHKRAGERANSILSDLSNSVRSIPSTEFTILFDKNLLKSEQKALKDEIALETDPKLKKLKENKLASLEVISNNDEFNPTYYEKHIKNVIKSYRSSETDEVIEDAVAKLKDIIDLKDNEKDLLKNINWLIQPANYARYFETHVAETEKVYDEAVSNPPVAIEDKPAETKEDETSTPPLSDFKQKLDTYARRFNEEGQGNHRKIKQELFGDVEDIVDNLEDSKYLGERMAYWRAIVLSRNNLQNLLDKIEDRTYDDLAGTEKFVIRQAKDLMDDSKIAELYQKVQDLLSFNEKMGDASEKPKPVKGTVKKNGIFTPEEAEIASSSEEEPDVPEEKVVVPEPPYQPQDLQTTHNEIANWQDKTNPIAILEDYGYFKGRFLRDIQSESLLGNYDFVVIEDSDELIKHHNSTEFKGKKFEGDNPFTFTGEKYGYVIVVKSKQGDILYFDKNYRKVSKEEGVPLIYNFPKTTDRKLIEASLNSKREAILDVHKVSPGVLEEGAGDIFPVSEFIKGTHLEDKAKEGNLIFISTTEDTVHKKGKYYLSLGKGMNDIQVITRWMSQLQLDGEKINPMDLLSLTYDNEDVPTQVAEYLNGVIYTNKKKGNFFEVVRKDDKFIIEPRGLSLDQYAKNNLNLERKHLDFNYKGYQGEKVIYYVKDGKLQSKKVIYIDFALENTLTSKKKLRTIDGKFTIEPVNNKLIFSLPRPSVKAVQAKTSTVSEGGSVGVGGDVKSKLENEGFKPTLKPNGANEFILQVDDTKPNGKRSVGVIGLKTIEIGGKKLLSIGMTNVREGYEGKGLATNMYRYLMENLPEGYDGILSPKETRWNNEQIPKIHEKLSKEYDKTELNNGDIVFKNKAVEQSLKEQSKPNTTVSEGVGGDVGAKKADIEKRRKEELSKMNVDNYKSLLSEVQNIRNINPSEEKVRELGNRLLRDKNIILNIDSNDSFQILSQAKYRNEIEKNLQYLSSNYEVDKINAKYDAEYVDAVKKGEMTKEQAMQALEKVGRKDSDAYAELKALEQHNTSNVGVVEGSGGVGEDVEEPKSYAEATDAYKATELGGSEDAKNKKQALVEQAETEEGKKFVESEVSKLEKNDDGTITVFRSGTLQEGHNPATTSRKTAEIIAAERKKQGLSSDIVEVKVNPSDISVVVKGIESEVFVKVDKSNKERIDKNTVQKQKTKAELLTERDEVQKELEKTKKALDDSERAFNDGTYPFSENVFKDANKKQKAKIKNLEWQLSKIEQSLKETTKAETTPTTSNQSEIDAKKADIEIGKVGNTEYEVKVDGVYYQGKKLNNPKNKTHRQLIEADIERRRQEELNNPKEGLTKKDALIEAQKDLGNLDTKEKRDRNKDRIEALKQFINLLSNSNSIEEAHDKFKDSFTETTPVTNRIAELFNAIFGAKNNINAKYDAELAALEGKKDEFVDTSGKIDREAEIAKALKRLQDSKDQDTDITNLQNKQGLFRLIDSVFNVDKISSDEVDWLKSTFDDYPIVIRIVNDIINGNAWGQFTQDATYIYKGAKKGTGYHEAWHNFTQLFLTKDEKLKLYNDNKLEGETNFEVEERLADRFMQFAQSNGTVLPEDIKSRGIFQKIWDFIKALFGEKTISADKLFKDLYKGNLNGYEYSKSNSLFSTLNAAILDNEKKEILSVEQAKQYFDHFDSLLGQYLADKSLFFNFLLNVKGEDRIKLLTGIYTNILVSLNKTISDIIQSGNFNAETDQTLSTINKIFDNKEIVLQSWTQRLFKAPTQKEIEKMELQEKPSEPEAEEEGELQVSDLNPEDEEQVLNKTGEFTQQSIATTLTKETKALIRLLSKVQVNPETGLAKRNSEGKIVLYKNEAGLTEPVNPSIFIDTMGEMLADTYTYDVMYETIRNTNNIKKLPELELLLERLPNPADNGDFSRQLRSSFERDFNRSYVGVFDASLQRDNDGVLRLFFQEETKRGLNYIKKKFSENFQKLQPSKYIQKTDDGKNSLTKAFADLLTYYNSKDDSITKKLTALNQIMELMGFKFTKNAANSSELKEFISNQDKALDLSQFFTEIAKRINDGATIKNPVSDLFQKREDGYNLARLLFELFSIEEKYSTDISSLTYQTAKGTQKYALMNPAFLFVVMNKIKGALNLTDLAQDEMSYLDRSKNPNINNSLVINSLFDKTGKRRVDIRKKRNELIFGDYNGLKHNIDGKDQRKQTTDLTLREKVIMDINSLLTPKMGYVDIMRTESSASSYFYKLNDYLHSYAGLPIKHSKDIPFSLELMFQDEREGRKYLYSYFAGIWQDEQDMMKKQGISSSGIFRDILTQKKEYTREEFNKALDEFFMKETNAFMSFMSSKGIASDTGIINSRLREELENLKVNPDNYLHSLARAYVVNTFVLNVEYSKIVSGPIQYYKAYHKRAKTAISTGILQSTSDYVRKRLEESFERTMGNILNPKKNFIAKTYKTLTSKDDVRKISKSTVKLWRAALGDKFNPKKIDKYDDINVADGQGRISFDGYREFRIRTGTWGNEEEATYLREVVAWKNYKGLEITERDNQLLEAYKDYKDVPFKPIKAQYDGHMAKEGHYPVAHKFSLSPLIPSVVAGTPLEDVHEYLLENDIAYMLHESGSKKYQGGIAELFKKDEKGVSDLYSSFLKEQIITKSKRRDESTWGTQMRKLFLANLFEKGKAGGEVESLYKEYIQNMNNIMQEEKDALYREFGIKEEGGKIVISDVKPFIDSLLGQMEARNLNQNLKNSIKYDDITGTFKYPLEINLNRQDIINLIGGMIDRRLRRLKVNGDILTLISSSGMLQKGEELRFYEPVFDKKGNFTHVKPMQVKIGWSSHYTPLLGLRYKGETISNVDNLNKALRDEDWVEENMESLLHIGYRIPTQGPNSMEFFVPAEFLSEVFYGVMPPPEYVVKTGGDFDDDKLHIFRPTLDVNGNIANDNYINTLRKRKAKILEDVTVDKIASKISSQILSGMEEEEDFDDVIESLPKEVKERMKELKSINSEIKGFYHNKSLGIYHKILSSPEMFEQLITPNSASEVKDMAVEIGELLNLAGVEEVKKKEDFKATQVFLGRNNYTKFLQNLSGKAHLGMWAVNNTFSQLLQQAGITINKAYVAVKNIKGVDMKFKRTYNQHLMTQEEKKQYGASLSNLYFPDGKKLRQEIISELINATVDIASDPFYSFLGINEHNKGVVAYLLQQGVPFRRIILFINQSPLRTYYNMREREPFRDIEGTAYPTTNMLMMDLIGIEIQKNMRIVYENTVERIDNSHTGFTEQELYDNVKGTDDDKYSKKILAHFVKLREQAEIFRKVQMSNSYDTTKYSTSLSALQNENMKREVEESGLFNNVQNIQKQSLVSSFDNRNVIRGVFSSLFPFGYNEEMVRTFDALSPKLFNKKDKERFERRVAADFIEYIVKNYGYSPDKDKNFAQYAIELITDVNPLYKRILDIKTKYPELEDRFEIISKIFPNFEAGKPYRKNLEIIRNIDNNTDYQELLIDDYKKMLKFSPSMINKTSMPNEDVNEIRKIMYDLAYVGFMQSGFNKSLFFFSDVIPTEIFNNNFTEALEKYMRLSQDEKVQFIKSFRNEFVNQNPEAYGAASKQSYRGKAYGLNKVKITSEKLVEGEPTPVAAKVVKTEPVKVKDELYFKQETPNPKYTDPEDIKDEKVRNLVNFLNDYGPFYFYDLPSDITTAEAEKILEGKDKELSKKFRRVITPDNIEKAKSLDKKYTENIHKELTGFVDLEEEYKDWSGENYVSNDYLNVDDKIGQFIKINKAEVKLLSVETLESFENLKKLEFQTKSGLIGKGYMWGDTTLQTVIAEGSKEYNTLINDLPELSDDITPEDGTEGICN